MITSYAVAVNTNLQENEGILTLVSSIFMSDKLYFKLSLITYCYIVVAGLHVKFHVMKSGKNGEIVSIRMSEQLQ